MIACAGAICLQGAAGADESLIKIEADGHAQGIGLHARQRAIEMAQQKALRELAESLVGVDQLRLVDVLVGHADAFVHTVNVTRHDLGQGTTGVTAQFLVNLARFRRAAAQLLLPELLYKPRVVVIIADRLPPEEAPSGSRIAEMALGEACGDAGLDVADALPIRAQYEPEALAAMLAEKDGGDVIGRDYRCDVAILGTATTVRQPTAVATNVQPHKARLVLRVIRCRDGKLVESAAVDSVVNSVDFLEGATQAIQDACAKLAPQIIDAAVLSVVDQGPDDGITLTIENPSSRANFETVLRTLTDELNAGAVEEVFYSDQLARVHLTNEGDLREVVRPLVTRRYPSFRLEQLQTYGRQSVLRLHAAQR